MNPNPKINIPVMARKNRLFQGLVAVFICHHRDDHEQQKEFEEGRYERVEVPYVWKIENTLLCQVELYRTDVEFYRSNECYRG